MTYEEALETMCRRCTNYEMCQGTGCNPKNVLLELIEKWMPKKPKEDGWLFCPTCGRDILMDRFSFCPDCGTAIDWSDTEDD